MPEVTNLSSYGWQLIIGFAFLLTYVLLLLWARSVYIARANRVWTDAHGDAVFASLKAMHTVPSCSDGQVVEGIQQLHDKFWEREPKAKFRWQLTWSGAKEIGDWVRLHEAKRLAAQCLPDSLVMPRFERIMGQLDELPVARRQAWTRKWAELTGHDGRAAKPSIEELRGNLVELLAEVHNARDAKYAQLAALHSKAYWLISAALLTLAVLLMLGHGVILLAGAIGGLISRLQRIVFAEGLPTSYGSSWVPLFCAPLLGALAAWAGLHLIALLQTLGVVDLRNLLPSESDLAFLVPARGTVGLAVLLGVSERFLQKVGHEAERFLRAPDNAAPKGSNVPKASRPVRQARGTAAQATHNSEPVSSMSP